MESNPPETSLTVAGAVEEILSAAYSDSLVKLDKKTVTRALWADIAQGGQVPTSVEVDMLVMGGDDGEIPPDLIKRYPKVNALLNEAWGV